MDTEAGRMLNKLYAGKNKVQINYPRINTVSRKENMAQPRFIPAGGKKDVNPRSNRIMKVNEIDQKLAVKNQKTMQLMLSDVENQKLVLMKLIKQENLMLRVSKDRLQKLFRQSKINECYK